MAANFKVTSQRPSQDLTAAGVFVDTVEVTYETIPTGIPGTETFPKSEYTPEHVAEVLTARAAVLLAVHNL